MNTKQKVYSTLSYTLIGCVLLLALSGCTHTFEPNVLYSTVTVGLEESFTVLHVTDTHLTFTSISDSKELQEQGKKRSKRFGYVQENKLTYAVNMARIRKMMICHTGDLTDFLSDSNLAKARDFLNHTDCIFTPGNHDVADGDSEARARLQATVPYSIDFYYTEYRGVYFVALNNSDHRITAEQLLQLQDVVREEKPVVLLLHVPLYTPDLYERSMQDGDSAYLMAVPEEYTAKYPADRYESQKADKSTQDAYDYIVSQSYIKCILAGHLHFEYETTVGDYHIPQIVGSLDTVRYVTFR